jgi:hypothetical protein
VNGVAQYDTGRLLEMAGARIRGRNRADCPRCKRFRVISFTAQTFFCHGIDCGWKGNAVTLAKDLGISFDRPSSEEMRQIARAHKAASILYERAKARRFELLDHLHNLNRLELAAHDLGPTDAAWDALETVYRERPRVEQQLDVLESGNPKEIFETVPLPKADSPLARRVAALP